LGRRYVKSGRNTEGQTETHDKGADSRQCAVTVGITISRSLDLRVQFRRIVFTSTCPVKQRWYLKETTTGFLLKTSFTFFLNC